MEWWDNRPKGTDDEPAPGQRMRIEIGAETGTYVEVEYHPGLLPHEDYGDVPWRVIDEPQMPPQCRTGYLKQPYFTRMYWYGLALCYKAEWDSNQQRHTNFSSGSAETRRPCPKCPFV